MGLHNQLIENRFVRHVASMGAGTIAAHVITLLASPFITRLFTPEEFGMYSLFHSLVLLLSFPSTAAYEFAIVLPQKDRSARNLFKLSFLSTSAFILICYGVLLLFGSYLSEVFQLSIPFLILLPFAILTHCGMNIYSYWCVRKKYFNVLSLSRVSMASGTGISQISFGLMGLSSVGLLLGYITGRILSVIVMSFLKAKDTFKLFTKWKRNDIWSVAESYIDHPKFILPSSLISAFAIELPVFLIAALFGSKELGFFALAFRVLSAPVTLAAAAVGQVYYQKIAEKKNEYLPIRPTLIKIWGVLFSIGIIPFTLAYFYSEPVFSLLFGSDWVDAGTIGSILCPMLLISFMVTPTSKTLLVVDKHKYMTLFSALSLIVRFSTLYAGFLYFDFFIALWLMVAGQITVYIFHSIFTWKSASTFDRQSS